MTTKILNLELYPIQHDFVASPDRFTAMISGIGAGKSYAGAVKSLLNIKPKTLGLVVSPTYPMLRDATLRTFLEICKDVVTNFHKGEMRVDCVGGAEVLFRSADDPNRLRGANIHWAWIDEASLCPAETREIVMGRLRAGGQAGPMWITSTPKGRNWLYKASQEMTVFRANTDDNPYLSGEFVDSLKATYTGQFARQELYGEFVTYEGLVYEEFDRSIHLWKGGEWPAFTQVIAGVDEGFCYSDDTEVLTRQGWFKHWEVEDKPVACFDTLTNEIIWDKPLGLWEQGYVGDMIEIDGKSTNCLVSPNHTIWVSQTLESTPMPYGILKASDLQNLPNTRFRVKASVPSEEQDGIETFRVPYYYCNRKDRIDKPLIVKMSTWLHFLGWFISEGSTSLQHHHYSIELTQAPGDAAREIDTLLAELPYTVRRKEYINQWGKLQIAWRICCRELYLWLQEHCGIGAQGKKMPALIFDCSTKDQRVFLQALLRGDGGRLNESRSPVLWSSSRELLNQAQALVLSLGYASTMSFYEYGMGKISLMDKADFMLSRDKNVKRVHYNGKIYCLQTKTGFYVTRRKGKVAFQGNTNPAVCLTIGVDNDGRAYVIEEFHKRRVLQADVVGAASDAYGRLGVSSFQVDPSAAGLIAEMQQAGLPAFSANNAVMDGIQIVKSRLVKQGDGKPRLWIHPSCVNLLAEMESYCWREGRLGQKDEPEKVNDHGPDALRYAMQVLNIAPASGVSTDYDRDAGRGRGVMR